MSLLELYTDYLIWRYLLQDRTEAKNTHELIMGSIIVRRTSSLTALDLADCYFKMIIRFTWMVESKPVKHQLSLPSTKTYPYYASEFSLTEDILTNS